MILTISGFAGTGKSTVLDLIHARLGNNYTCIHSGNVFRAWAQRCELDVREFALRAPGDEHMLAVINAVMDEQAAALGIELPAEASSERDPDHKLDWLTKAAMLKPGARLLVEGRSGAFLALKLAIPAFNVRLVAHPRECASRVVAREGGDFNGQLERIQRREEENRARFRHLYKCDLERLPYDLVVDTTERTPQQVAQYILDTCGQPID